MITPFHAKYYANELILQKAGSDESKLSSSLFDSVLTINPHQVDAALFAFKSPLSKGVILADEVGLGKTIEAGLVMCQLWSERKRKQLVICPASLRKQWSLELSEKFNLPSVIIESKTYNEQIKKSKLQPFAQKEAVVITSYQFAAKMSQRIEEIAWDIVVIDEAHKLRNSYRQSNVLGQAIKQAVAGRKKLLLTATPLQNNLAELYGLSSVIDDHIFGDIKSFRQNYVTEENTDDLKYRLSFFCKRTLRKDVLEYVKYTERFPIVKEFSASDDEQKLYDGISSFLQRENSYAVPSAQKQITTLVIRKVLASSTWAVRQTLQAILDRLLKMREGIADIDTPIENLTDEDERDLLDEIEDDSESDAESNDDEQANAETAGDDKKIDKEELDKEITELQSFIKLAESITTDTKSITLLDALKIGFDKTQSLGGNRKALIFTESRRTQEYLRQFLSANGYEEKIVLFNGSNSGKEATTIYNDWYEANKYTGRISGSNTADKRNALIEYFRDKAEIMIATEAAAEGVNLQFCSLVINYDLPWNPQRIEQRIGRCHRYGQKNDVVVVNFINNRNYADVRVHELLDQKFSLFRGVFGSSDEVLGTVESGVDFEQKILSIYQHCRTHDEIAAEFDRLQKEMEDKIARTMKQTKEKLFKNFDVDVNERLKASIDEYIDRYTRYFWALTEYELADSASFNDSEKTFMLNKNTGDVCGGQKYALIQKDNQIQKGILYRLSNPLGQYVIQQALNEPAVTGKIIFLLNQKSYKVSLAEQLKGKTGYLSLAKFEIDSFEKEEHLLFCGMLSDGTLLSPEQCRKLFECGGRSEQADIPASVQEKLMKETEQYASGTLAKADEQNLVYVKQEEEQLDKWSEDMIQSLEKYLSNVKVQIRDTERLVRQATTTEEHCELQEKLQTLEKHKRLMRSKLEENEDEIEDRRKKLIDDIHNRMKATTRLTPLFTVEWNVL